MALVVLASPTMAQPKAERRVFFGEQHVHTSWSFDAFAFGDTGAGPSTGRGRKRACATSR